MSRTPRVVEDRREQIIEAAMRAFAQKGFARTSNRDVAREAGITTGLIYYYFENKEALLSAVLEKYSPVQIVTQISPEMLELPPETFLPLVLKRAFAVVESEAFVGVIRLVLPEIMHNAQLVPITAGFLQRVVDFLEHYLKRQVASGRLRSNLNQELAFQTLMCSIMGFALRRQILHDASVQQYTHDEIVQTLVEVFLRGLQQN